MALVPITPPPGVFTNGTDYSQKGRWVDSNLTRWVEGVARPVGGWERFIKNNVEGIPLRMFSYSRNSGIPALVIGTTTGVYYYDGTLTDITPDEFVSPSENGNSGYGWGAAGWGAGTYGTPRTETGLSAPIYNYYFDNWGDSLILHCNSDGKIYKYAYGDLKATVIPNAPTNCAGVIVSDERFVIALGAGGDFSRVEWCDREDYTVWAAEPTNMAGGININSASKIIHGVKWRGQIIIFTESDFHQMRYLGAPLVYGVSKISDCPAPVSPRSTVASGSALTWVSHGSIMQYDGSLRPLSCPVWDFYKENVNRNALGGICAGHNSFNSELWFFFPSAEMNYPDRYLLWNYKEALWSNGYIGRSAWVDSGAFPYPMAITHDGIILKHESTSLFMSYGIGSQSPFLMSAPMDVADGTNTITVDRLVPDESFKSPEVLMYTLEGKRWPSTTNRTYGPMTMSNGKIDLRATARQFAIRIDCPTDIDYAIGVIRANIKGRGTR